MKASRHSNDSWRDLPTRNVHASSEREDNKRSVPSNSASRRPAARQAAVHINVPSMDTWFKAKAAYQRDTIRLSSKHTTAQLAAGIHAYILSTVLPNLQFVQAFVMKLHTLCVTVVCIENEQQLLVVPFCESHRRFLSGSPLCAGQTLWRLCLIRLTLQWQAVLYPYHHQQLCYMA